MSRLTTYALRLTIALATAPAFAASEQAAKEIQPDTPAQASAPATTPARSAAVQAEYILQPFDKIKIEVFKEPQLDREVRLDQDSSIELPLIKRIELAGKTVREAQTMIRERYDKDFLVNPQINVSVIEFTKRTVNVFGTVASSGAITIPPDRSLNVLDAITQAGGFIRLSDRKKVKVTRTAVDGITMVWVLNLDEIDKSSGSEGWILKPGDAIYVPERPF